jgi:folate-binding Fe-S cluster repair protein YgfZ
MATQNKVFIQIDNEKIELTGADLDSFLQERQTLQIENARVKAAEQAQAEAKALAQAKLAALGLTVEDLQALGL